MSSYDAWVSAAVPGTPEVAWLLEQFADETPGLTHAVLVSLDGLRIAAARRVDRDLADQLAALTAGLLSLSNQLGGLLTLGGTEHVALRLAQGHVLCMRVADTAGLVVAASAGTDLRVLAYQMTGFVGSVAHALSPEARPSASQGR